MGSILNTPRSPERFYVYRVTNPGDNPTVEYLDDFGDWANDLDMARLFRTIAGAKGAAADEAAIAPPRTYFNVARLTLEIDPLFDIKTFPAPTAKDIYGVDTNA